MSRRTVSRRPLKKISIGDMRDRISFYTRAITSPVFNSAKFTETYTLIRTVWAEVLTLSPGQIIFADVDVGLQPTHVIKIRYWSDITTETMVKWKSKNYDIVKIVNPEERKEYLFIWVKLLGDDTLQANQ